MKTLIVTDLITNKLYDIICALCIWQMTILDASVEAIYKIPVQKPFLRGCCRDEQHLRCSI